MHNESSLDMKVEGMISGFFSDSDMPIREQEIRRFLPQISPYGLILMHDASSHLKTVREAALKLEHDGLLSAVLLPAPRGVRVVGKNQEGRTERLGAGPESFASDVFMNCHPERSEGPAARRKMQIPHFVRDDRPPTPAWAHNS